MDSSAATGEQESVEFPVTVHFTGTVYPRETAEVPADGITGVNEFSEEHLRKMDLKGLVVCADHDWAAPIGAITRSEYCQERGMLVGGTLQFPKGAERLYALFDKDDLRGLSLTHLHGYGTYRNQSDPSTGVFEQVKLVVEVGLVPTNQTNRPACVIDSFTAVDNGTETRSPQVLHPRPSERKKTSVYINSRRGRHSDVTERIVERLTTTADRGTGICFAGANMDAQAKTASETPARTNEKESAGTADATPPDTTPPAEQMQNETPPADVTPPGTVTTETAAAAAAAAATDAASEWALDPKYLASVDAMDEKTMRKVLKKSLLQVADLVQDGQQLKEELHETHRRKEEEVTAAIKQFAAEATKLGKISGDDARDPKVMQAILDKMVSRSHNESHSDIREKLDQTGHFVTEMTAVLCNSVRHCEEKSKLQREVDQMRAERKVASQSEAHSDFLDKYISGAKRARFAPPTSAPKEGFRGADRFVAGSLSAAERGQNAGRSASASASTSGGTLPADGKFPPNAASESAQQANDAFVGKVLEGLFS